MLLTEGGDEMSVQDVAHVLGHTTPVTTLTVYAHVLERAKGRPGQRHGLGLGELGYHVG